jgi:arsenate reductase (glutaredoxin)
LTIKMYGIKNCDTVKKARAWLENRGTGYSFHDYRVEGLEADLLKRWCDELGWEVLLNKSSSTFRELPGADKENLDAARAMALMLAHPTMIKRPVLDADGRLMVGFKPDRYDAAIAGAL